MNDGVVRTGAIMASLLLHGVWFIQAGGESGVQQPMPRTVSTTVTHLTFTSPQKEVVQTQTEQKPEPVKKQQEKAKPVKKEIVKQEPTPEPPQEEQLASIPEIAAVAPMLDEGMIAQEKERYLAALMAHIEKHKRYPKTARRRGITGELTVKFRLMHDGSVHGLEVRGQGGGSEVLVEAARKSVEMAMPLPLPPSAVDCPIKCKFRMKFSLDEV